jgi:manganese efflux pump family protein
MNLQIWELFLIAVALGGDAFSVALSVGTGRVYKRQTFRLSFHFGLFQFLMPLIGFAIGRTAVEFFGQWDHWIASGILFIIAIHMIKDAFTEDDEAEDRDLSRGWFLVSLSIATSIDALAVGLTFGIMSIPPLWPSCVIGVVAAGMTLIGLKIGRKLRAVFGKIIQGASGILLLIVAFNFLRY